MSLLQHYIEPPIKKCKMCWQYFPSLPALPVEIVEKILKYLPVLDYVKIVGPCEYASRQLLVCKRVKEYFQFTPLNYHPTTDLTLAGYADVIDTPIAQYLATLCALEDAKIALLFFNNCLPVEVRTETLNNPARKLDEVLSNRWIWWRLMRNVLKHEHEMGRNLRPSYINLDCENYREDIHYFNTSNIFDVEMDDVHSCPLRTIDIYFDLNKIMLFVFLNKYGIFRYICNIYYDSDETYCSD